MCVYAIRENTPCVLRSSIYIYARAHVHVCEHCMYVFWQKNGRYSRTKQYGRMEFVCVCICLESGSEFVDCSLICMPILLMLEVINRFNNFHSSIRFLLGIIWVPIYAFIALTWKLLWLHSLNPRTHHGTLNAPIYHYPSKCHIVAVGALLLNFNNTLNYYAHPCTIKIKNNNKQNELCTKIMDEQHSINIIDSIQSVGRCCSIAVKSLQGSNINLQQCFCTQPTMV